MGRDYIHNVDAFIGEINLGSDFYPRRVRLCVAFGRFCPYKMRRDRFEKEAAENVGNRELVSALYNEIAYSTTTGRSFAARAFPIPAHALALHFTDARNGYVIGDHGMVYGYRIVPVAYQVPGLMPAVAAP